MDSKPTTTDSASAYFATALTVGAACLATALEYLKLGFAPLALCPPDHVGMGKQHCKNCTHRGKVPWHRWLEFEDRRPTERELRDLWRAKPNSNVGTALGPGSGLVRIDIEGEKSEALLAELAKGDLPDTWTFTSGRGRGLLYRIPVGVTLKTTPKPLDVGQELRFMARGGQTVLPPSLHVSGRGYEWTHAPWDLPCALMPAWLVEVMRADAPRRPRQPRHPGEADAPLFAGTTRAPPIQEGHRHTRLLRLAGRLRYEGLDAGDIAVTLLAVNRAVCSPPLDESEVIYTEVIPGLPAKHR
jgi:hypothetical protein